MFSNISKFSPIFAEIFTEFFGYFQNNDKHDVLKTF